jgi:hypothetical protein
MCPEQGCCRIGKYAGWHWLSTHQAANLIGRVGQVCGVLVHIPAQGYIAIPWLAALRIRVGINAAVLGHAADLGTGRADVAHVGVEHVVTQDAAVEGIGTAIAR